MMSYDKIDQYKAELVFFKQIINTKNGNNILEGIVNKITYHEKRHQVLMTQIFLQQEAGTTWKTMRIKKKKWHYTPYDLDYNYPL